MKACDRIQHLFMIENTQQTRNREEFPQSDKEHLWERKKKALW